MPLTLSLGLAALSSLVLIDTAAAWCECGYSTHVDGVRMVFQDLIESDFGQLTNIADDSDWQRQAFNLSKDQARGDYGEMFAIENTNIAVTSQPNDAGLNLTVSSHLVDGMVPVAEMDSRRGDLHYGTFRASLKIPDTPGTCAAFFWYWNDTQEIDIEFLTKDFKAGNNSYPVNLVLQSRESAAANYNAAKTGNLATAYLPFNPTLDFHEYRIDYLPGKVFFYADGQALATMNSSAVPTAAGRFILQHWSNGNAMWSAGPPERDTALKVRYVKAYFNSSDPRRYADDYRQRCKGDHLTGYGDGNGTPGEICVIPEIRPDNQSAADWFFDDHPNMTNNQTVYKESEGPRLGQPGSPVLVVLILVSGALCGLW